MDDDSRALDKGWDPLPDYGGVSNEAEEAVTVSISTAPSEWLVNTTDSVVVPMSMAEVVDALRHHKLNDRSLVWRNGMPEWQPVERVPQLKLAARLPSVAPVAPASSAVHRPPPPKASRPTAPLPSSPRASAPPSAPRASTAPRDSAPPQTLPSPRATLPGLPAPSRPHHSSPRNSSISRPPIPRAAVPPPASNDEADVLAVYERPAATISFELAQEPPRSEAPSVKAPHTLAPTTTDNAPRRNADLSVVAASQFRQVQRSSQRLLWISSIGSAAAASLLTLWLSSGSGTARGAAAARSSADLVQLEPAPQRAAVAPVVTPAPPVVVAETPAAAVSEAKSKSADVKASKPKAKRRARTAPRVASTTSAAASEPSLEANPYDVKLEDDPAPAPKATTPDAPTPPPDSVNSGDADSKPTSPSGF